MKQKQIFRLLLILLIVIGNISCDQISKKVVRQKVEYCENIELVQNHFILTKTENRGAFLSFGDAFPTPIKYVVFIGLPLLFLGLVFVYLLKNNQINFVVLVGLCFMIGGGIGNIYDRVRYGSVTDFLQIDFAIFRTGIFNFADVSVMIGVFLLLIQSFRNKILPE